MAKQSSEWNFSCLFPCLNSSVNDNDIHGGSGAVYRGKLCDGRAVAVKRAKKENYETRLSSQFRNEINVLAEIEHLNLVKLIGYLDEGDELILVVEHVSNGDLRQHLDCVFGNVLDMSTRLDIAIDVSHALNYLHLYAGNPIIHRDVKASNILLTENLRAKVSDFGFSRVGPDSGKTHVVTEVKGTAGYLDPEYLKTYKLSTKSDVYAFGIVLIELVTGRRPIEYDRLPDERITLRWAYGKFQKGRLEELVDPKLEVSECNLFVCEQMLQLAFQCCAPIRQDRPTMKKASEFLWMVRKDSQDLAQRCAPKVPGT
ncbi:hypothetical protein KP509_12G074200 [Ceratopteris richardii]|uniref:non-specific serine/threonine protein kinase n=1 Tax=Ceratopteris richardii TaxID=49495 RepID=A0A8T2TN28_CERRI|nr:hypothetical protein KP509_12G074200 [Ceratopteris richardii]KAH7423800.1 hypothetical protein KP509_12G074200 [Ceratopteris richardii]